MSSNISISDTTRGEVIPYSGEVRFGYGANSPYPGEEQAPVPEASYAVASDMNNLYRLDNTARLEFQRLGVASREIAFSGRFASTSDAPIGQMNIQHASAMLNKDIRTMPILRQDDPTLDTSSGRRTLAGALRHWYSECQLTEFGVRGDFLFSTSNSVPNVAFYDHPTMRFTGRYDPDRMVVRWMRTEPYSADPGTPFEVGDSFVWINKFNELYYDSSSTVIWHSHLDLTSARPDPAFDQGVNTRVRLSMQYFQNEDKVLLQIRNAAMDTILNELYITLAEGTQGAPSFINVTYTRVGDSQVQLYSEYLYSNGSRMFHTWLVDTNIFPQAIALNDVWGSLIDHNYSDASLAKEGVQAIYVIKGNQYTIQEEDEWKIDLPYFIKSKYADIAIPGMNGNAWSMIHDLCSSYDLKFNAMKNSFSLYNSGGLNDAWPSNEGSQVRVQATARELTERVEVVNYNYDSGTVDGRYRVLYKADQVFSLALGERQEHVVQLPEGSSFQSIGQPQIYPVQTVINVWNDPDTEFSVYSVFDDDNLEVDPASWRDGGGYIMVEPTENVGEIKIIIQAPNNDLISKESNFHISIAGSDIPSLILSGSGVRSNKETISCRTGAGKGRNLKVVGEVYDNPLVGNSKIAWDVAAGLASVHGTTQTRAVGSYPPPTDYDYSTFPLLKRGSYYAPLNVTQTDGSINISDSIRYNPVRWVAREFRDLTCGQYENRWEGATCREANISPIGRDSH